MRENNKHKWVTTVKTDTREKRGPGELYGVFFETLSNSEGGVTRVLTAKINRLVGDNMSFFNEHLDELFFIFKPIDPDGEDLFMGKFDESIEALNKHINEIEEMGIDKEDKEERILATKELIEWIIYAREVYIERR